MIKALRRPKHQPNCLPDASTTDVEEIARRTLTAPHLANLAVSVDAASIAAAIRCAEALSGEARG